MPVVNVWIVRVAVYQWRVYMEMRVRLLPVPVKIVFV